MGKLFDEVRARVTAEEAAQRYGLEVRNHKALCPWHDDHSPSLTFKGAYCRCYACGNGGSCIDLTAQLLGLSPLDAARQIDRDFALRIEDAPLSSEEIRAAQEERAARQREKQTENATIDTMIGIFREAERLLLAGLDPENERDRQIAEAAAAVKGIAGDYLLNQGYGFVIGL